MKNFKSYLALSTAFGASVSLLALAAPMQAYAQQAETAGEIVVTATRRSASVTDIPLAVSAISGDALEAQGVVSFQDLTKVDATFAARNYGAAFNQYIIRGVSSNIGSTVGLYLDEAPILGGSMTEAGGDGKPGLRLHDVQRVEILRGPQGTLFGSGSMSGTLRVLTNRPDFEKFSVDWGASTQAVDDGNALTMGDFTVNLPVNDRIALRGTMWAEKGGGYIDHQIGTYNYSDVNDVETLGGRLSASVQVTDAFKVTGMLVHQEIDVDGSQAWSLTSGPYIADVQTLQPYRDQYDLAYVEGTYDFEFGSLLATYSHTRQWVSRPDDTSPTANFFGVPGGSSFIQTQDFEADTAELRFTSKFDGPFQLVAGAYYEDSTVSNDSLVIRTPADGSLPCLTYGACTGAGFTPGIVFSTLDNIDVEQYALYAQGDYKVTDKLTVTLGARYYEANIKDYGLIQQDVFAQDPVCATYYTVPRPVCGFALGDVTDPYDRGTTKSSENKPTYNISLLYEATADTSFYTRAGSGFRIGGINNSSLLAASGGVTIPRSYAPDSLWSYEAGIKKYFWERRGYFDFAVYHMNWKGQQLNSTDVTGAFDFTVNAGKTIVNGVELQGSIEPITGLTIGGGVVYTDANLAEDLPLTSTAIGLDGDPIPYIADWSGSVSAQYEWPLMNEWSGFAQVSGQYRSSAATAFNASDPNYIKMEDYTLWDAAVGVRSERLDVKLFVDNITNKAAQLSMHADGDGVSVYSPRPLSVGIAVSGHF